LLGRRDAPGGLAPVDLTAELNCRHLYSPQRSRRSMTVV
jgi:hypothetical protein